jgi:DNA-binding NarL/FixJ family response regulator
MQRKDCVEKTRVLIGEDHPLMREGIHSLIDQQPDMVVCGESETASDALAKTARLRPDVASVDLNLGNESGLDMNRRMRALGSTVNILILSSHDERCYAERAAAAGAHGHVTKQAAAQTLFDAIRELALPRNLPALPSE